MDWVSELPLSGFVWGVFAAGVSAGVVLQDTILLLLVLDLRRVGWGY